MIILDFLISESVIFETYDENKIQIMRDLRYLGDGKKRCSF